MAWSSNISDKNRLALIEEFKKMSAEILSETDPLARSKRVFHNMIIEEEEEEEESNSEEGEGDKNGKSNDKQ